MYITVKFSFLEVIYDYVWFSKNNKFVKSSATFIFIISMIGFKSAYLNGDFLWNILSLLH